ncbi:hypothetical protein RB195_008437 [Necator americanus]|uniref:C-type lectin domain-containing protein n=1 Tax=Necator americanus TaxID=51031 RepID=A0ABR1CNN1_NECAM
MDDCFRSCYENVNCMYNEYKNDKCSIFASGDVKHSFKGEAYTIGRDKIDESCEREVVLDESRSKKSFVPALNQEGNPDVSWIGLRLRGPCDPSSRLKYWWDGSDVNFQYWNEGEPNNVYCIENSTAMQPEGKWADYPDYYSFNFICQTESIVYCSKHYFVDYGSTRERIVIESLSAQSVQNDLKLGPPVISIRDYTICCGNADERNVGGSGIAVKNDYNNMVEEFGSTSLRCFFVRMLYCRGHNLWMVSAYAPTETVVLSSLTENRHPTSERRRIENKIPPTEDTVQMRRKMFAFQWEKTRFTYNSAFFAPITYDFDHETRLKMKFRRLVQEDRDNKWTSRAKWTKRCSTFLSTANGVAVVEATLPIQGHHFSTLLDRQTPSALELEHVHRQIYAVDEEPPTQSEVLVCIQKTKLGKSETPRYEKAGFRRDRSTIDKCSSLGEIWDRYSKLTQLAFLDFEAAFDSPYRWCLLRALRADGVPEKFFVLLDDVNKRRIAALRTPAGCTTVLVATGVSQGAVAGPFPFDFGINDIMRRTIDQGSADIVKALSRCLLVGNGNQLGRTSDRTRRIVLSPLSIDCMRKNKAS